MTARLTTTSAILMGLLALAGCGSDKAKPEGTTATDAAGATAPSGWDATDACAILDKAAVGAILKREVPETRLALVHPADTSAAATSECTYLGKDGSSLATLLTRWSPINDNDAGTIAAAHSAAAASVKAFTDKPVEDIPGLGKAAFIVPKIDALNVFIDDARLIIVTPQKLPDGASGKDIAIQLAKQAGA